jgi:hypothetical protein
MNDPVVLSRFGRVLIDPAKPSSAEVRLDAIEIVRLAAAMEEWERKSAKPSQAVIGAWQTVQAHFDKMDEGAVLLLEALVGQRG